MDEKATPVARTEIQPRRPGAMKAFWRSIRKPLAQSRFSKNVLASMLAQALRFIKLTNPLVEGSSDLAKARDEFSPAIIALWHGQHLLAPAVYKGAQGVVAMVSRSADAEMNAMVVEKLGLEAVRGSGGREGGSRMDKGGARALIALKKALDAGKNVAMIADIPKGKPRDAGLGIVTLAKLSGRPVVPLAVATSRRKVLEKSWDKTAINLPFGRGAAIIGDLVRVPANASDAEMEQKRQEVTASLNAATEKAYRLVDRIR
ncbi:lysophospholipid acyltransferase family protein [Mesorhizobium sp. ZC-5]|uniref:lysophospholipid acyltransferase family protein n=1 Tax=Mesorhizobium sp. ZC-5 TaxID=2986066 RepID=UPI0021E99307|nr:lysophospholipid acyltransferase family protein [Mesorhizobium sp. ZC-5]MCV3242283.1 lysophospholipid acyltransferase family protein [Mesorhizobium sp. ZC-5]